MTIAGSAGKPYSEACERNRAPILEVLRKVFAQARSVLEIGSGTGQHAVHFAAALPHLVWQTSDLPERHDGINAWLAEARLPNARPPLALDVNEAAWPEVAADAVFSANTLHILSWRSVENMFRGVGRVLDPRGVLVIYGPFNRGGRYTSSGNAVFDAQLRRRDPHSGLRDLEAVTALARTHGLACVDEFAMPANNFCFVWRRAQSGCCLEEGSPV